MKTTVRQPPQDRNTDEPTAGPASTRRAVPRGRGGLGLASRAVIVDALRLPGSDGPVAKLAEWGRDPRLTERSPAERRSRTSGTGLRSEACLPGGFRPGGQVHGVPSAAPPLAPLAGLRARRGQWQTVVASGDARPCR